MTGPLDSSTILTSEFDHISQVYSQNNEDRARVSTFYLVTVASIIAALLSFNPNLGDAVFINAAFAILFCVLSITGILTILQLVRLRQAWLESVDAMNNIKDYYAKNCGSDELESAFLWKKGPDAFKPWSLATILAVQVAILSGATLGASIVFSLAALEILDDWMLVPVIVAGVAFIFFQIWMYWFLLTRAQGIEIMEDFNSVGEHFPG